MKHVAPFLRGAGAALVVLGVVIGLPMFGATVAGLSLVVAGAVCVLVALGFGPPVRVRGARRVPMLAVVGGAVVVVGAWLSVSVGASFDTTSARVNTLAEESIAIAKGLNGNVRIVAFLDDDRAATELRALYERYAAHTKSLTLELRSSRSAADMEVARALGVAEHLALGGPNVVVATDLDGAQPARLRFVAGDVDAEVHLTNALRRATSTTLTKVYFVEGHGEVSTHDEGPVGASRLADALRARGVEVVPLPLAVAGAIPDDARALIVTPGTQALADAEVQVLHKAIDAGVPLVLALEPDRPSAVLSSLSSSFGVDVVDDVIVDDSPFSSLLGGADTATGQGASGHPITRPLRQALTHFSRATLLGISPMDGVVVTELVQTGAEAKSPKTGARGPLPLAVAVVRGAQRVVVFADTSFMTNAHVMQGANLDLAQNSVLWVSATDDAIAVRPKRKTGTLIFLTPSGRQALAFVLVLLLPSLCIAGAVGFAAVRRSR